MQSFIASRVSLTATRRSLFALENRSLFVPTRKLTGFPGTPTGQRLINADGTPRVVFISGAAQGIGRASALRCASEGASVCISDLPAKEAEGKKLVEELKKVNSKGNHSYMNLNVVDEAQWEAAVKEIEKRYGRLDVLVNNAGVFFHEGKIPETSLKTFKQVQSVNVDGVFLATKWCIPLMAKTKSAEMRSIVNLSSIAGLAGSAFPVASYHTSKGAVRLFTKSTALYCATEKNGIRCNSVHPGLILTPLWAQGMVPGEAHHGDSKAMDKMIGGTAASGDVMGSLTPLGRAGTAEDVAEVVVFLASNESSFMTGSEMVTDGGYTAQ